VGSVLKVFSYLPNPRVWKSVIAANIGGVEIEVVGDKPENLSSWLWDYDARELLEEEKTEDSPHLRKGKRGFGGALYKTEEFLESHPFGTVPAAFSPGGEIGVFESNSILRSIARSSKHETLYGRNNFEASRIDSYLDANLVFAREAQVYLLEIEHLTKEGHSRMTSTYEFYLSGIESSLSTNTFIASDYLTIADISYVCDFAQFLREGHYLEAINQKGFDLVSKNLSQDYPLALKHLLDLSEYEEFSSVMGSYLNWYKRN
jgi:elongation factor 1-gamma|tara:strand:+ start:890 stop:1672 length:783 start_codon:yes stop_codon:yes gene_type:complete